MNSNGQPNFTPAQQYVGHTFGQLPSHIPQPQPFQNTPPNTYVFHHHYHHEYYPGTQHFERQMPYLPPAPQSWVPPDPFVDDFPMPDESEPIFADLSMSNLKPHYSPVQKKEEILEEIVRECEEIERRSSSGGSPNSSIWSSDDRDTPDLPHYHPYKSPEKKERKKAQNRLAATRYREKKRKEKELAMNCIEGLTVKNNELKTKAIELEREIGYLKNLIKEIGLE
ncbi:unnamed protein product [Caenorhabditis bovis]|uniref:BZIP domain-containing protein n=1 Tax=Caenorhabditis bovis TaxID=2654633 RepID=A0A8S1E7J4_9PELO|nr:unnamed protein product [Caenorhabditis bovis]